MSFQIDPGGVPSSVVVTEEEIIVEITVPGPAGADGAPGTGAGYRHVQGTPASTWTINHNLNKFPNVTAVDSSGAVIEGDVTWTTSNTLTIAFGASTSGEAYVS